MGGFWITNKGELLPVNFQDHHGAADKYVLSHYYKQYLDYTLKSEEADVKKFVMSQLGWVRLSFEEDGLDIEFIEHSINTQTYKSLVKYIKESDFSLFRVDLQNTTGNYLAKIYDLEQDSNALNKLLRDIRSNISKNVIEASNNIYGYWISDEGELIEVLHSHGSTFSNYRDKDRLNLSEYELRDIVSYDLYWPIFKRGWIRLVSSFDGSYSVNFGKNLLSSKAISTLIRFTSRINNVLLVEVTINENMHSNNELYKFKKKAEFVQFVKQNINKSTSINQILSFVIDQINPTFSNIKSLVHSAILAKSAKNRLNLYKRIKNVQEKVSIQSKLEKYSKIR